MIKKIVKLLTNPQGALVQIIIDHIAKIFKLNNVLHYVEKPNELDVAIENMIKKQTEIDLKIKAMQSVLRDLDNNDEVKKIKNSLDKLKKLKSL